MRLEGAFSPAESQHPPDAARRQLLGNRRREHSALGDDPLSKCPLVRTVIPNLNLTLRGLPLFSTFFLWSLGSGAQQLARPLFAASFGVPIVLVTLITTSNSVSRTATAPLIGYATDRWGRKPLLVIGVALRAITTLLEFYASSYLEFLILEFIGGIGVSTWITGSSILMADVTTVENRGRVLAIRSISSRVGAVLGPLAGAALAGGFGLRSLFLFNTATKVVQLLIVLYLIRETRPDSARARRSSAESTAFREAATMFLTRPFLLIAGVSLATSMMGQGVFLAIFPVYMQQAADMSTSDIGVMLTVAATATLLAAYPAGAGADRYGRKRILVPGLLVLALSAYLLAQVSDYRGVLVMILLYGVGEAFALGASQAYVVDVAPEARRGTFLGAWSLFTAAGGIVAPLLIGLVADLTGFGAAFLVVAVLLIVSAIAMALWGPDFGGRPRGGATLPGARTSSEAAGT